MSVAETRGYAIAHAAGIAEAEVDQIFARRRYSPVLRARVVDSAVARLVNIVIHNTLTVPSPNTARMKAA